MGRLSIKNQVVTKRMLKKMKFSIKSKELDKVMEDSFLLDKHSNTNKTMDSISFYKFL